MPHLNHEGGNQGCWYPSTTPSGLVGLPFGATFCADLTHGIVDEGLYLVRIGVGIARLDVLYGAMKNMARTACSMNFERSHFFMPCEPR